MPNVPAQFPNIDLPGAEFLSIAPNATIALQGRRRNQAYSGSVSIPASTSQAVSASQLLETTFVPGSGVYVHDVWLLFSPADAAGQLTIQSSALNLALNNSFPFNGYPMGLPSATLLTPVGGQVIQRDGFKMVLWRDIAAFAVSSTSLYIGVVMQVKNNDATNPHSVALNGGIVYTRLDGIME